MWSKSILPLIFLLIAFMGVGILISMIFGMFGSTENKSESSPINDLVAELRQNQSNIILIINNNTNYSNK